VEKAFPVNQFVLSVQLPPVVALYKATRAIESVGQ